MPETPTSASTLPRLNSNSLTTRAKWNVAYECFRDDVERCYKLGIRLYNWQ